MEKKAAQGKSNMAYTHYAHTGFTSTGKQLSAWESNYLHQTYLMHGLPVFPDALSDPRESFFWNTDVATAPVRVRLTARRRG